MTTRSIVSPLFLRIAKPKLTSPVGTVSSSPVVKASAMEEEGLSRSVLRADGRSGEGVSSRGGNRTGEETSRRNGDQGGEGVSRGEDVGESCLPPSRTCADARSR